MPPMNPRPGDVWTNLTGYTVGAINPGETAVWSGAQWVPTFGRDPASIQFASTK